MSNTKQKPEITVEELVDKVFPLYGSAFDEFREEERIEFLSDLRSVIRGMLIKYEEYMNGGDDYIDKFLNENWEK